MKKGLFSLFVSFAISSPAFAATFNVDTTVDNAGLTACDDATPDDCSLRGAINVAENNNDGDTINLIGGTYDASVTTFTYTADNTPGSEENFPLTLIGAANGSTVLDGGNAKKVLEIQTSLLSDDSNAAITLQNITIQNGNGGIANGGGLDMATAKASVIVEECDFIHNTVSNNGGGASVFTDSGAVSFNDNIFTDNSAGNNGGGASTFTTSSGTAVFSRNIFTNNLASNNGGGAVVFNTSGSTLFDQNTFTGNNHAGNTGGGATAFPLGDGPVTFTTNLFSKNSSESFGGGVSVFATSGPVHFIHNTVTGNNSNNIGGGATFFTDTDPVVLNIYNNIIWGNTATTEGQDIEVIDSNSDANATGATLNIFNNNFSDLLKDCDSGACTFTDNEAANIDQDPLFVDAAGNDFHLQSASPAINAGSASAPSLPATDSDGDPRTIGAAPDMGTDEFTTCGDGAVNAAAGEECDDGNTTDGDGCSSACQNEADGGGEGDGNGGGCNLLGF